MAGKLNAAISAATLNGGKKWQFVMMRITMQKSIGW